MHATAATMCVATAAEKITTKMQEWNCAFYFGEGSAENVSKRFWTQSTNSA